MIRIKCHFEMSKTTQRQYQFAVPQTHGYLHLKVAIAFLNRVIAGT